MLRRVRCGNGRARSPRGPATTGGRVRDASCTTSRSDASLGVARELRPAARSDVASAQCMILERDHDRTVLARGGPCRVRTTSKVRNLRASGDSSPSLAATSGSRSSLEQRREVGAGAQRTRSGEELGRDACESATRTRSSWLVAVDRRATTARGRGTASTGAIRRTDMHRPSSHERTARRPVVDTKRPAVARSVSRVLPIPGSPVTNSDPPIPSRRARPSARLAELGRARRRARPSRTVVPAVAGARRRADVTPADR